MLGIRRRVFGLWLLGTLAGCAGVRAPPQNAKPTTVDFAVTYFADGRPYQLKADRGHVVVVDVWATWCEPCRDTVPELVKLQQEYADAGVRVYALNVDADAAWVRHFLDEVKVEVPVLADPDAVVAEGILKVRVLPTMMVIDELGQLQAVDEGQQPPDSPVLKYLQHRFGASATE